MSKLTFFEFKKLELDLIAAFNEQQELENFTISDDSSVIYQAKSASDPLFKEWLSGSNLEDVCAYREVANELLILIFDNNGKTFDRFSVIYNNEPEGRGLYACRGMSENPFHPQGFGQMCSAQPGRHLGRKIGFSDLPNDCQRLVMSDLKG